MEAVPQQTASCVPVAEFNHNTNESIHHTELEKTTVQNAARKTEVDFEAAVQSRNSNAAEMDTLNHNEFNRLEANLVQPVIPFGLFKVSNDTTSELQESNTVSVRGEPVFGNLVHMRDDLFNELPMRPRRRSSNSHIVAKQSENEPNLSSYLTPSPLPILENNEIQSSRLLPHINAFIKERFHTNDDKWQAERPEMTFPSSHANMENVLVSSDYVGDLPTRFNNEYHGLTTAVDVRKEAPSLTIQNPKVNGDHAPSHETDTAHPPVIKHQDSFNFSGMNNDNTTVKTNNNAWPSRDDDEHSRCSSLASSVSCSTATSSSHHLIIDQPLDEMEGTKSAGQPQVGSAISKIGAPQVKPIVKSRTNIRESPPNKPRTKGAKKYIEPVTVKKNGKSLRTNTAKLKPVSMETTATTVANNVELSSLPIVNHNLSSTDTAEQIPPAESYFYCTLCANVHEHWNVFWHIYWKHDRYICIYCFHSYNTAEKLSLHLELKHDRDQRHFSSEQALFDSLREGNDYACESRFFVCCTCQHVFEENDQFSDHVCSEYIKPCAFCEQKGRHSLQCKFHPNAKRSTKVRKKAKEKQSPMKATPPAILPAEEFQLQGSHQPPPFRSTTPACDNKFQNVPPTGSFNLIPTEPISQNHSDINVTSDTAYENSTSHLAEQPDGNGSDAVSLAKENVSMDQIWPVLPPDREKASVSPSKQLVPKIKLCVPKQFQKSVDEALSTSDSDDEEAEESSPEKRSLSMHCAENNSATESATEIGLSQEESNGSCKQNLTPDDDSVDEPDPKLARILQDIERTKMDIQRTKECMHHTNAAVRKSGSRTAERIGSPTPPSSPKTHTDNTEHVAHDMPPGEANPVVDNTEDEQRKADTSTTTNLDILSDNMTSDIPQEPIKTCEAANDNNNLDVSDAKENLPGESEQINVDEVQPPALPADGIEVANEDVIAVELPIADRPLDQYDAIDFVRLCLQTVYPICLYCNHARRIAVNGSSLILHMLAQHRFTAELDTATKELSSQQIVEKLKSLLDLLDKEYLNSSSYCTVGDGAHVHFFNERIFECFQCRFSASTHKELYLHNRKVHPKPPILCHMCRGNFYTFSEILCHICQGAPHKTTPLDVKFRCCLCEETNIPSAFRLMVHLRQRHFSCDVCLEDCLDQAKLSQHVWKHKLSHVCYRCGISYRSKLDIAKHLFWKHDTESITCKRCLQKKWRMVYHFCTPPSTFVCDDCQMCFTKAMHLRVHKRIHTEDFRHPCIADACEEKFISRRLLEKHSTQHSQPKPSSAAEIKSEDKLDESGSKEDVDMKAEDQKTENEGEAKLEKDVGAPEVKQENVTPKKEEPIAETGANDATSPKKKKRKKRSKESLDDLNLLNLRVPNLSETDTSDDSESEEKSKDGLVLPKPIRSPVSNDDSVRQEESIPEPEPDTGQVPAIWKQFFEDVEAPEYTEDDYPRPNQLHVVVSDHDYCRLYRDKNVPSPPKATAEKVHTNQKRHNSTSTRRSSSSSESSSSSSSSRSSSSSSSSRSSCSSSSSSSSDDSDSSAGSNKSGYLKSQKSHRKRSASISPLKKPSLSERQDDNSTADSEAPMPEQATSETPKPLAYNESDLETNESETDEDFYEEHPQKIATDLSELSQKRAQLMARTRLSPSNNYDIVENSRPSTPSLPGDVTFENRVKSKKKKRERRNTGKFGETTTHHGASKHVGTESFLAPSLHESQSASQTSMDQAMERFASHPTGRRSEGSSCSDADGQLKRSKRQRRPNKFYGYTSDDESMAGGMGQNSFMRSFRPPPPPNFTWRKEDLPSPSKRSAKKKAMREASEGHGMSPGDGLKRKRHLNSDKSGRKRPSKKPKFSSLPPIPTLKIRPLQIGINFGASSSLDGFNIPDSLLNRTTVADDSSSTSSEDEAPAPPPTNVETSRPKPTKPPTWRMPPAQSVLPAAPPRPPSPQTTAFNHRIPPALLPNPNFQTLQYFKANNIRYPIRPPVGARQAREGESVYCYCRCPYDEVSEMIACDGGNCLIEWFHFECVGIMVAPQGKWFCAECRPKYSEELYPTVAT